MGYSKQQIQQYNQRLAKPTLALSIIALSIYIFTSVLTLRGELDMGWALAVNALMAYLLFTSMHEASHLNISGNQPNLRWIDEVIGWLSGVTLISPFYLFRVIHFRHHAFTNHPEKDPDHWLASKNIISLIFHSVTIFPVYLYRGFKILMGNEKVPNRVKRDLRISFFVLALFAVFFVLLGIQFGYNLILHTWIYPAVIAQVFLAFSFDWLPHHPHFEQGRYKNTRIIKWPLLNALLLGQNFHLIHHLHPRIPFYRYRDVFLQMEEELKEEGAEIMKFS
jgi:fatty acid desaturase